MPDFAQHLFCVDYWLMVMVDDKIIGTFGTVDFQLEDLSAPSSAFDGGLPRGVKFEIDINVPTT